MRFDKIMLKTLALKCYCITSLNSSRLICLLLYLSILNKLLHKNLISIIVNGINY